MRTLLLILALILLGTRPARAYETDPVIHRGRDLRDATPAANAWMDEVLEEVIEDLNDGGACGWEEQTLRRRLGRAIYKKTAASEKVNHRGFVARSGFGVYSAWLEVGPVDRIEFVRPDRDDVFSDLSLGESVILKLAGPASSVRLAGVFVGTDKIEHFFSLGWKYYRVSRWGLDPERAIDWGTLSEHLWFGTITSRAFSYADLRANHDGFLFYQSLLRPGSVVGRDGRGCLVQTRPWDWAEWIDWEYDELLNPSVYAPIVQRGIDRYLALNRNTVCAARAGWADPDMALQVEIALRTMPSYAGEAAPERTDPFQLERLCGPPPGQQASANAALAGIPAATPSAGDPPSRSGGSSMGRASPPSGRGTAPLERHPGQWP